MFFDSMKDVFQYAVGGDLQSNALYEKMLKLTIESPGSLTDFVNPNERPEILGPSKLQYYHRVPCVVNIYDLAQEKGHAPLELIPFDLREDIAVEQARLSIKSIESLTGLTLEEVEVTTVFRPLHKRSELEEKNAVKTG